MALGIADAADPRRGRGMRRRLSLCLGTVRIQLSQWAAIGASSASLPKSKVVGVLTVPNSTADGRVFTRPQARDIATEPHCAIRKETGVVGVLRSRLAIAGWAPVSFTAIADAAPQENQAIVRLTCTGGPPNLHQTDGEAVQAPHRRARHAPHQSSLASRIAPDSHACNRCICPTTSRCLEPRRQTPH